MESPENNNLAFVIRIWSEENENSDKKTWRGRIISIHNEQQYLYFQRLSQLVLFIAPFMSASRLRVHWSTRLLIWLARSVHFLSRFFPPKRERGRYESRYGEGTGR